MQVAGLNLRDFCVIQTGTAMHRTAIKGIGRPGNSLKNIAKSFTESD